MLKEQELITQLELLTLQGLSVFDILPEGSLTEKIISVILNREEQPYARGINDMLDTFKQNLQELDLCEVRVVVLGGGSGLSNVVGGDSRRPEWSAKPFRGLKQLFAHLTAVVCVTDDGGSTGELLKELPLIALGDLRHVLLSSIRREHLERTYALNEDEALDCTVALAALFNYRFASCPQDPEQLLQESGASLDDLPSDLKRYLTNLTKRLYADPRLSPALRWPQCLGNLLLAAAIYKQLDANLSAADLLGMHQELRAATIRGLAELSLHLGVQRSSVLPCTTTPSQLQILYGNGVLVTSEDKSGQARRGYPVDRVLVDFTHQPFLPLEVAQAVEQADVIVLAPGSLYSSIIPVLQVPGLAQAIRNNQGALKVLVANIWVQKGETDVARDAPHRKFYVSDLIRAYHRNIPGGVHGLFSHVVSLDMSDIPGSVLQRYALEAKEPIYLDRDKVRSLGFFSVEAKIFLEDLLHDSGAIQHDPNALAEAIRCLWLLHQTSYLESFVASEELPSADFVPFTEYPQKTTACLRYSRIRSCLQQLSTHLMHDSSLVVSKLPEGQRRILLERISEIIRRHPDILVEHLQLIRGIVLVTEEAWERCQEWDKIFSFYDPEDRQIKIRRDQAEQLEAFEVAFLLALGQSLLGNYITEKQMGDLYAGSEVIGRIFSMEIRQEDQLRSFLTVADIDQYLQLSRMYRSQRRPSQYTRVVNPGEGFTPPGLFFGLFYAWYLDNRFAANIEYKMSVMRTDMSDLIPEQVRILQRRRETIRFFRERVFRQAVPNLTEKR